MPDVALPIAGRPYALVTAAGETGLGALDADALMALYRAHGALLLRGFAGDLSAFHALTQKFCSASVFNESPDRLLLDAEHNIQSVNGGDRAFPLHPELSREPWKPDACFFTCLNPPSADGATTLCDGIALVEALPPAMVDALRDRRLVYIQPAGPELLEFWLGIADPDDALLRSPPAACPYFFRRTPPGGIIRGFTRPVLHRPMFAPDRLAFGNFLLFARYYIGLQGFPLLDTGQPVPDPWLEVIRTTGERLTAAVAWQRGDVLILDNTRFMHGRTAIRDPGERSIASYFGYLRDAPANPEEPAAAPWRSGAFRPPAQAPGRAAA